MAADIQAVVGWVGTLLAGPFGGLIGGALSFLVLELGVRRLRRRRDLADALAAELINNADSLQSILDDPDRDAIPPYFNTSDTVFAALVGQLGELPYDDVSMLAKHYHFLDQYNRLPQVWHERFARAVDLPEHHPFRESELPALREVAGEFYEHLEKLAKDCRTLAVHLRTRHVLGLRRLLPRRLRPNM